MNQKQIEKTKFSIWLFETGKTLKYVEKETGVCYPTLENLVFARLMNYRHRTLRDVAKCLKWSIPELLEDVVIKDYTTASDKTIVVKLCKRYNIPTDVKVPVRKKAKKVKREIVEVNSSI